MWKKLSVLKCKRKVLFAGAFILAQCFLGVISNAQIKPSGNKGTVSVASELKSLYDISELPAYQSGSKIFQVSSYDTTGGNDDGFSGKYSFIRKEKNGDLVILDAKGNGVINRIWTPTPTDDTLDFYIDDTTKPAFSIKFRDLFSGNVFPFIQPLCGNEVGGFYSYIPIPFQKRCKIVYRGPKLEFYQIQYRLYPEGTPVKNFSMQFNDKEKAALQEIAQLWDKPVKQVSDFIDTNQHKLFTVAQSIDLEPGESKQVFTSSEGGRIVGIEMDPAEVFAGNNKQVDIQIHWDDESIPAVDCPVADFFGYAFGKPSMQSLLLGSQGNKDYCYFPMPFDKKATITLAYRPDKNTAEQPVKISARIYYTKEKRNVKTEGKFYTHWSSKKEYPEDGPHVFLDTKGKGQYVGTILQAQGLNPGMTLFFEGDDSTAVDGQFRMHGTGSEDYFNGGWYALVNRWDGKMSLPIHGSLTYSLPLARTGGYRLFLSDKIPFEKTIFHSMEHGPTDNVPVDYTSLAFYYSSTPPATFEKPNNENTAIYRPDTLIMYPQLMKFTIGGRVDLWHKGPMVMTGDNGSLARIDLDEIPAGKYKLYIDYNKNKDGGDFSIWQRQVELTQWISSYSEENQHIKEQYLCDIDIEDFKNTLTFKFKTVDGRKSLSLNRLIFMRIKDQK